MSSLQFLLYCLFVSVQSSSITVNDPSSGSTVCTASETSCDITVNGPCSTQNGCASSNTEYHCPSDATCTSCTLDCNDNEACAYSTLYSYECDNVEVTTSGNYKESMKQLTIYGPNGGDLYVSIESESTNVFDGGSIVSQNTNDITVNISGTAGDEAGYGMNINVSDATGIFYLDCGVDCGYSNITCPMNDNTDGTSCFIDCSSIDTTGSSTTDCKHMNIYTQYGIPRDVKVYCNSGDSSVCSNSLVYCFDETESCTMTKTSSWSCSGGGCVTPTNFPTTIPTTQPVHPTTIPSGHPSSQPSDIPSNNPTSIPSSMPSMIPSVEPSNMPHDAGTPSSIPTIAAPTSVPNDITTSSSSSSSSSTTTASTGNVVETPITTDGGTATTTPMNSDSQFGQTNTSGSGSDMGTILIVSLVAGCVVLVILIILMVLYLRSKSTKQEMGKATALQSVYHDKVTSNSAKVNVATDTFDNGNTNDNNRKSTEGDGDIYNITNDEEKEIEYVTPGGPVTNTTDHLSDDEDEHDSESKASEIEMEKLTPGGPLTDTTATSNNNNNNTRYSSNNVGINNMLYSGDDNDTNYPNPNYPNPNFPNPNANYGNPNYPNPNANNYPNPNYPNPNYYNNQWNNINNNNNNNNNYQNNMNNNTNTHATPGGPDDDLDVEIVKMITENASIIDDYHSKNNNNNNNNRSSVKTNISEQAKDPTKFQQIMSDGLMVGDMVVDDIVDEMNNEQNGNGNNEHVTPGGDAGPPEIDLDEEDDDNNIQNIGGEGNEQYDIVSKKQQSDVYVTPM